MSRIAPIGLLAIAFCLPLFAAEPDPRALEFCRRACDQLCTQMEKCMHDDMLQRGLAAAAVLCAEKMDSICAAFCAEKPGVKVQRVTLLGLKEKKLQGSFAWRSLKAMTSAGGSNQEPKREDYVWEGSTSEEGRLVYLRSLVVKPECLQCHGPAVMVPPEVKKLMKERYHALPSENKLGEVKGGIMVTLNLPQAKSLLASEKSSQE